MATAEKHKERSKRSNNTYSSRSGMYAMNQNSNLKTMAHRRLKDARKSGDR